MHTAVLTGKRRNHIKCPIECFSEVFNIFIVYLTSTLNFEVDEKILASIYKSLFTKMKPIPGSLNFSP